MSTKNEVLLNDILYFYKDKPNHIQTDSPKDSCYYLVRKFFKGGKEEPDVIYINEINRRINKKELTKLETFKYFTEDEARQLVTGGIEETENGEYFYSQKWHLYVSYMAYKEVTSLLDIPRTNFKGITTADFEKPFNISNFKQIKFKKWLKKEATANEDATWEQVEEEILKSRK
ncbi:hypothetical protein [Streptococcus sp. UMB0029]|uniref:hypothetical protein n=1 Tax=Streptococcus sp. UMB0029 TaxID=2069308 RepID=UPI000C80D538|nr:hypothetical protein [Streptococcus sp. UMB0029]PMC00646.1 hypothetical protein CJ239_04805 [Streptococcus sp. UMB0029]